jgi:DNA-binding NtrC family response regulator
VKKKILIVDDIVELIDLLKMTLENYDVISTNSYEEAKDKIKNNKCDLAIVDMHLGVRETGLDIIKEIETNSKSTKIIILSGLYLNELDLKYEIYQKPITAERLELIVKRLIGD